MRLPSSETGIVRRLLYRSAPARLEGRFRLVGGIRAERFAANGEAPVVVLVHSMGAGSGAVAHLRCSSLWFGGAFRGYDVRGVA